MGSVESWGDLVKVDTITLQPGGVPHQPSARQGQMVAVNIKILIGPRVTLNLGLSPSGPATDWNYVMSSRENIGVDITED